MLFTPLLNLLPFENLFWTFHSPEEVYAYRSFGPSHVVSIVSGEDYDMIVGTSRGSRTYDFVPKTEKGWKIWVYGGLKEETTITDEGLFLCCQSIRSEKGFFLTVGAFSSSPLEISDSRGSEFVLIEKTERAIEKASPYYSYGAYIADSEDPYSVTVDGASFRLDDSMRFTRIG